MPVGIAGVRALISSHSRCVPAASVGYTPPFQRPSAPYHSRHAPALPPTSLSQRTFTLSR